MKKFLAVFLAATLCFGLMACGSSNETTESETGRETQNTENTDTKETGTIDSSTTTAEIRTDATIAPAGNIEVEVIDADKEHTVRVSALPTCVADLQAFDLTNEFQSAAAMMCALMNCFDNFNAAVLMIDELKGPEDTSAYDKDHIKNQLEQYPYVMKSYVNGTSPESNYDYQEIEFVFTENPDAYQNEGYVKLYIKSSGADSPRPFQLRQKTSTGEWFMFSDSWYGLLAGICMPALEDPWN